MSGVDYLEVVLNSYLDMNNRKFMKDYFKRQYKIAGEKHYSADEFFVGCRSIVQAFEDDIKYRKSEAINDMYFHISFLKREDLPEEEKKAKIQELTDEIEWVKNNDSRYAYLSEITGGRYHGHLLGSEVEFIRKNLLLTHEEITDGETVLAEPKKEKKIVEYTFADFVSIDKKTESDELLPRAAALHKSLKKLSGNAIQRKTLAEEIVKAEKDLIITIPPRKIKNFLQTFWPTEINKVDSNYITKEYNILKGN